MSMNRQDSDLPLQGIRVLELAHTVMGPTTGLIMADLGAEVIKIEKMPDGDDTRRLKGFGAGFFPYFNRNKKSLCLNLKDEKAKKVLRRLIKTADVLVENFGPGTIDRLGFGYEDVKQINPRLIFCSLKGFMPGPYEKRLALDEVVQMMGGLAYMTGPSGRPLRAGASVTDIMGGTFGVIGILTALLERQRTGRGQFVKATLFEAVAFMVAQHMAVTAVTGQEPPPMPERGRAWAVYDLFETSDDQQVFIGITSDYHWERFCTSFGFSDLLGNPDLSSNQKRIEQKEWLLSELARRLQGLSKKTILQKAEEARIPFAPVARPAELFSDLHLNGAGWLLETRLPQGIKAKLPKIPLHMKGYDFGLRRNPPRIGEGSKGVLASSGFSDEEIQHLVEEGVLAAN